MSYSYSLSDSLEWLRSLPRHSVHCFVTSPPYWGLRDYGFAGQIGQEETLEEHIDTMVSIFSEAFRALHPSGTLWMNYGDAWAQSGHQIASEKGKVSSSVRRQQFEKQLVKNKERSRREGYPTDAYTYHGWQRATGTAKGSGLAPKQKLFLPHRVAMALQSAGWWVRDDIPTELVWRKPNAKPEPDRGKPTKTHEYIFLLSKNPRYYYDDASVTEASGARLRSVWTINNVGTTDDHTATFPEELARRCILLGSNPFACASCGMPYSPVYEELPDAAWRRACGADGNGSYDGANLKDYSNGAETPSAVKRRILAGLAQRRHIDNVPACSCIPARVPSVVADMFGGTATTGVVALRHGRHFVGCEGSSKYHKIGSERLEAARLHIPVREHRNGQLSLLEEVI